MQATNLNSPVYSDTQEIAIMDKPEQQQPEWITAQEAAEIMEVAVSNVYYLCRNKRIECRKWSRVWQISKQAAEDYERSNRNPDWLHDL